MEYMLIEKIYLEQLLLDHNLKHEKKIGNPLRLFSDILPRKQGEQ